MLIDPSYGCLGEPIALYFRVTVLQLMRSLMSLKNDIDLYNVLYHKDNNKDLQDHYVLNLNPEIHTENKNSCVSRFNEGRFKETCQFFGPVSKNMLSNFS